MTRNVIYGGSEYFRLRHEGWELACTFTTRSYLLREKVTMASLIPPDDLPEELLPAMDVDAELDRRRDREMEL